MTVARTAVYEIMDGSEVDAALRRAVAAIQGEAPWERG